MQIFLKDWIISINKVQKKENTIISSLAPKILTEEKDIQNIQPYLDSLKKTIDADDITNIALTGGYGSGKSTIIKTFQHRNQNYKYLNISLASFNAVTDKTTDEEKNDEAKNDEEQKNELKKEELERLLEVSILQQIFYHVKPSTIPDSRFKRIVNITSDKILGFAIGLIIWFIAALLLFKFDYINKINPLTWVGNKSSFDWIAFLIVITFFVGIGIVAKIAMRTFSNSRINKLTIQGEMELGENIDKSVFNEHLEEIIYFFERTDYDVVIIEDLDRFNSTDIFIKLREINILLNNSIPISEKRNGRKINFVYAIKDEIFTDKNERVKFFEYIIPVIPFINPSNAGEQLTKLINEAGLVDALSKDFTEDVVTFIDDIDMRLLINIFHEYQIYKQNLAEDLNQDKLFAIITYKNLFPHDFGELHKRRGSLYKFISNKNFYIKQSTEKIQNKILAIEKTIAGINNEKISSIRELRAIYVNAIHRKIPSVVSLYFNRDVYFPELLEDTFFEMFLNSDNLQYKYYENYSGHYHALSNVRNSNTSFSDIQMLVNEEETYERREENIKNKLSNKIEDLRAEIQQLITTKNEIESWTLVQIFDNIQIEKYLNEFSDNLLIRNLLINGYISEDYSDYISLFHEVNLTKGDFAFERKIKSGEYCPYDYKLVRTENLIKKISEKYFARDTILNIDLLNYLGQNFATYSDKYLKIITLLGNEKNRSIEFIDIYVNHQSTPIDLFIKHLYNQWPRFWDFIDLESNYTEEKTLSYFKLIMKYADSYDIITRDNHNLKNYIANGPLHLNEIYMDNEKDKIESILNAFDIKFEDIEEVDNLSDFFNSIYEKSRYEINLENIQKILLSNNNNLLQSDITERNYSTILKSGLSNLISNVNSNINKYVTNVIFSLYANLNEEEDAMLTLLNNDNLKNELKSEVVFYQKTKIENLKNVKSNYVKNAILKHDKVLANWKNILCYYEELEEKLFDQGIISFLNKEANFLMLSVTKIKDSEMNEIVVKDFIRNFIVCNDLNFESYQEILKSFHVISIKNLSLEELNEDKIELLITSNFIAYSIEDFTKLKDNFESLHIDFFIHYQNAFIETFEQLEIYETDAILLLQSGNLSKSNKIKIIEKLDAELVYESKKLGALICDLLIESDPIALEYDMIEYIFRQGSSIEKRITLLNLYYDQITNVQIKNIVLLLDGKYSEIFEKQHKPTFINTLYHRKLFEILDTKGLIIRYEEDKKDSSKLKVYAKYLV